nr:DUF4389 domain-containing protein [Propionibacterium sp.]
MATQPVPQSPQPYPVRLEGASTPQVSRALWLIKWLLAVPHYFALALLAIGAVFVWLYALVTIVATGRYPRAAFDYLLGVLRWSWRVMYYLYNAGATDAYPPFTLADVPDYPARLDVEYPERLSQGLALVKWWLLAIPHHVLLALMFGFTFGRERVEGQVVREYNWPGLVPIFVLVALLSVLINGRYPQRLYDVVMGMNRWRFRVLAYVLLMTDVYPPFRLDEGAREPGGAPWPPEPGAPGWRPEPGAPGWRPEPGAPGWRPDPGAPGWRPEPGAPGGTPPGPSGS